MCTCGCDLPLCACGWSHQAIGSRCRECDLADAFASMECSRCGHLRYRDDLADICKALWGEPCARAEPKPSTVLQAREA